MAELAAIIGPNCNNNGDDSDLIENTRLQNRNNKIKNIAHASPETKLCKHKLFKSRLDQNTNAATKTLRTGPWEQNYADTFLSVPNSKPLTQNQKHCARTPWEQNYASTFF